MLYKFADLVRLFLLQFMFTSVGFAITGDNNKVISLFYDLNISEVEKVINAIELKNELALTHCQSDTKQPCYESILSIKKNKRHDNSEYFSFDITLKDKFSSSYLSYTFQSSFEEIKDHFINQFNKFKIREDFHSKNEFRPNDLKHIIIIECTGKNKNMYDGKCVLTLEFEVGDL